MISVIFRFLDEDGKEKVSIGNSQYFHKRLETSKQLIEFLGRQHNEEDWKKMMCMTGEELCTLLLDTLEANTLHTIHPN